MISNPLVANPGLRGGANVSLTVNGMGVMASAKTSGGSFAGYFRVALNPQYCTVSKGTVESVPVGSDGPIEPVIMAANGSTGGVPISGSATQNQPQLALDSSLADPTTGLSYVTLAVTPVSAAQATASVGSKNVLTAGTLNLKTPVQVVHLGNLTAPAGTYYEVIAAIQWRGGNAWKVIQHVYFNLKFVLITPAPGQGAPYGFFPPS